MITELGLDGAMDLADFIVENDLVELGHHLSRAELAEFAAQVAGRTQRMLFGHLFEIGPGKDFRLDFFAGFLCLDKNMPCGGSGHRRVSLFTACY